MRAKYIIFEQTILSPFLKPIYFTRCTLHTGTYRMHALLLAVDAWCHVSVSERIETRKQNSSVFRWLLGTRTLRSTGMIPVRTDAHHILADSQHDPSTCQCMHVMNESSTPVPHEIMHHSLAENKKKFQVEVGRYAQSDTINLSLFLHGPLHPTACTHHHHLHHHESSARGR